MALLTLVCYLLWLYSLWQGFFSQRIARAAEAWAGHNWMSRMLYVWSFHRTAEVGFLFAGVVTFVAYATREQRSAEARRDARTHAHAAPAAPMHTPSPPPLSSAPSFYIPDPDPSLLPLPGGCPHHDVRLRRPLLRICRLPDGHAGAAQEA